MENIVSNTLISLSPTTTPLKKQRYAAIPIGRTRKVAKSHSDLFPVLSFLSESKCPFIIRVTRILGFNRHIIEQAIKIIVTTFFIVAPSFFEWNNTNQLEQKRNRMLAHCRHHKTVYG